MTSRTIDEKGFVLDTEKKNIRILVMRTCTSGNLLSLLTYIVYQAAGSFLQVLNQEKSSTKSTVVNRCQKRSALMQYVIQ